MALALHGITTLWVITLCSSTDYSLPTSSLFFYSILSYPIPVLSYSTSTVRLSVIFCSTLFPFLFYSVLFSCLLFCLLCPTITSVPLYIHIYYWTQCDIILHHIELYQYEKIYIYIYTAMLH